MADTSGTKVVSKIVPTDTLDEYATHDADYGRGGYRSVADITERDAITTARRKQGMAVYVNSENKKYILKDGITNTDWVEETGGTGGGAVDSVNGETGVVVLDADDISDAATVNKFASASQLSKIDGVESGAQVNPTSVETKAAYELNPDTNAYTDAEKSKLASLTTTPDAADVVFDDTNSAIGETSLQLVVESLDTRLDDLEGAGGFTDPTTVSGCVMWLDGADDAAWTVNGSNEVTAWIDKSPNEMTSTVVNAPTRTVLINGHKAVTFNGDRTAADADYIKLGTQISDALSGKTGVTAFYVYKNRKDMTTAPESQTGYAAQQVLLDSWGGTEFTRLRHYIHEGYAPYEFCRDHGDNGGSRKIGEYDMAEDTVRIVDHRSSVPNKTMDVLINGAEEVWTTENLDYSKAVFETANGSSGTGNSEDSIGAECYDGTEVGYPFGSTSFRGEVCEIILYDRRLTATQMTQIRNYLANKWDVTVAGGDVSDGLNDLSDVNVVDNVEGHVLRYDAATATYKNGFPEDVVTTWANATAYSVDDLVEHDDYIYRCKTAHTSAPAFSTHSANWVELNVTQGAIRNWVTGTSYIINDVVLSPADEIYMCTSNHTASALFTSDSASWKAIAASGGGGAGGDLNDLDDVSAGAPTDTQVLTWVQANSRWEAVDSASGGTTTLSGLTDTTIASPADKQCLQYDNSTSKWINTSVANILDDGELGNLSNVNIVGIANNHVLTYNNSTGNWENQAPSGGGGGSGASELDDLDDVTVASYTDGIVLKANGTAFTATRLDYEDLGDVLVTAVADRDVMMWDASTSKWKPSATLTETPTFTTPYIRLEGNDGSTFTSTTNIDYKTVVEEVGTTGAWDTATNTYECEYDGVYLLQVSVLITTYNTWSGLSVWKDTGSGMAIVTTNARNYSTDAAVETFIIEAEAGDKLAIRWDASKRLSDDTTYHHMTIKMLQQEQNIALTQGLVDRFEVKAPAADVTSNGTVVQVSAVNSQWYKIEGQIGLESTSATSNVKSGTIDIEVGDVGGGSAITTSIPFLMTTGSCKIPIPVNLTLQCPSGQSDPKITISVSNLSNMKVESTTTNIRFTWLRDTNDEGYAGFDL